MSSEHVSVCFSPSLTPTSTPTVGLEVQKDRVRGLKGVGVRSGIVMALAKLVCNFVATGPSHSQIINRITSSQIT
jgi:hypothetical protein